ncbi:hypothetical protein KAR91_33005 [Candidatus Pacearchaeota archaeon]|nr:hypothetical protein [Candidatus Pacearchaeota archaeon]
MNNLTDREQQIKEIVLNVGVTGMERLVRIKELFPPEPEMELPELEREVHIFDKQGNLCGCGFFVEVKADCYILSPAIPFYQTDNTLWHINNYTWQYPQTRQYKWNKDNIINMLDLPKMGTYHVNKIIDYARETPNE